MFEYIIIVLHMFSTAQTSDSIINRLKNTQYLIAIEY